MSTDGEPDLTSVLTFRVQMARITFRYLFHTCQSMQYEIYPNSVSDLGTKLRGSFSDLSPFDSHGISWQPVDCELFGLD
jgi:hypothetical protein